MSIRRKIFIFAVIFYICVISSVVAPILWSWRMTAGKDSGTFYSQIEQIQHADLLAAAEREADAINETFSGYYNTVAFLKGYYEHISAQNGVIAGYPVLDLYPGRNKSGLPGYGYIHPDFQAYADFERLSEGSPWLPQRSVKRAMADPVFRQQITRELNSVMTMSEPFRLFYAGNKSNIDLIWVVLESGTSNVFPPYDYPAIIQGNPKILDLDESELDYVRLLNPENNPAREIKWIGPYFDEYRMTRVASVIAPLYRENEFLGTIGIDVLIKTIAETLEKCRVGQTGYYFLTDGQGKIITLPECGINELLAHESDKRAYMELLKPGGSQSWTSDMIASYSSGTLSEKTSPEFAADFLRLGRSGGGVAETRVGESQKTLVVAKVKSTGWFLGLVMSHEDLSTISGVRTQFIKNYFGSAQKILPLVLLFGLLLIFIIGTVAYINFVKPILLITGYFRKGVIESLDIEGDLPLRTDEIGTMARTCNELSGKLKRAYEDQKRTNEILEKNIAELDRMNRTMVGRELKIRELKDRLKVFEKEDGGEDAAKQ